MYLNNSRQSFQSPGKMGCLSSISLQFCILLVVVLVSQSHGVADGKQQQNETAVQVALGEDVFFECSSSQNAHIYVWQRDGLGVEAGHAYHQRRLFVIKYEGMLILNAEERDSGLFICSVFDTSFYVKRYRLEVVARTEDSSNSGDVFQCGYPRQRSRIIGGREVNYPGSLPWMALLWDKVERRPLCSGILLNRRYVVTAAHCFLQIGYGPNDVEVRLGEHNITVTENYEVTMQIAQIIPHPNFDQPTYDSDILLLRLQQPVVYSDYIIPICLPSELRGERLLQPGTRGYISGWGATDVNSPKRYSDVLRQARLSITDQQRCGSQHTHVITNNMFCAIGGNRRNGVRDACAGDTGGPFMVKEDDRYYLVGIVSWSVACADINFPGVYTRVIRFRNWILENINDDLRTCEDTEENLEQERIKTRDLEGHVSYLQKQLEIARNRDTEAAPSTVEVKEDSWTEYQFRLQNNWNSCQGTKYVRKRPTSEDELGKYVGVILCTNDRYKLFMADSLDSEFLNIADANGYGEDHCEFAGASPDGEFNLGSNSLNSSTTTGYFRSGWGDGIQIGVVGGTGPQPTGRNYPMWYECGVSIP